MIKPLSDLSQEDVFKYFSLGKRKTLAKSIKGLRKLQTKVPFRLNTVEFNIESVRIDDIEFEFCCDDNSLSLGRDPAPDPENYRGEHPLEMVTPDGKLHIFKDYEPFLRFLNYYVNRKGNWIKNFHILWADFKTLPNFRKVSIFTLQLLIRPGCYEHWAKKFLEDFEDFEFCEVLIKNTEDDTRFMTQLKEMRIKALLLVDTSNNDQITQLNFPKMELIESEVDSNGFLDNVKKFIENNPDRSEVYYQVHRTLDFDWVEFTRKAEKELGGKHRYQGYQGYISVELPNGREVQIWCQTVQLARLDNHWYILEARFEDRKPSTCCPLTGRLNLLAQIHFLQMLGTEKIQNHLMARERDENPHSKLTMECLYLLNNHYPRLLMFLGSFGFYRLALWALPKLPFRKWSFLTSTLFSLGVTWRFFRGYEYDCREMAVMDVAVATHSL